jgi:hypothetical protein
MVNSPTSVAFIPFSELAMVKGIAVALANVNLHAGCVGC